MVGFDWVCATAKRQYVAIAWARYIGINELPDSADLFKLFGVSQIQSVDGSGFILLIFCFHGFWDRE